jgi:hypothetical protein
MRRSAHVVSYVVLYIIAPALSSSPFQLLRSDISVPFSSSLKQTKMVDLMIIRAKKVTSSLSSVATCRTCTPRGAELPYDPMQAIERQYLEFGPCACARFSYVGSPSPSPPPPIPPTSCSGISMAREKAWKQKMDDYDPMGGLDPLYRPAKPRATALTVHRLNQGERGDAP